MNSLLERLVSRVDVDMGSRHHPEELLRCWIERLGLELQVPRLGAVTQQQPCLDQIGRDEALLDPPGLNEGVMRRTLRVPVLSL